MGIFFDEKSRSFKLDTKKSSYVVSVVDDEGFIGHAYYGDRISDTDVRYLLRTDENPFVPSKNNRDRGSFFDAFPTEYPGNNVGDYREGAISVRCEDNSRAVSLVYEGHRIYEGKPGLKGLPATFTSGEVKALDESACGNDDSKVYTLEIKTSGETVKEGEPFKCELAPATGYKFPYVIKVMMNGRLLKQKNLLRAAGSEYYTYDNTTGIIEIENVDGEIVIEAKGVQEGFFEVIPNLVNLTSDPASFEPLAKDSKVELTLKAASGYTLPTSITVKMGENTLASTDYTYNSGTGAFALEKITATLVITAAGNRIPDPEPEPEPTPTTYMVTLPVVEGATLIAESSTNVESGKSFAFTLTLKDGYSAPQLTVKANGSVLGPVSSGRYVIEKVTSNIVVTVTGIVKDNPTDNAEVDPNGLRVWGENGRLHIQTPVMDTACIVTFEGRLYRNLSLPVGETITSIPQGSYIIYIGNQSYKIRF